MMQKLVAILVGLALSAPAVAEPLVEGRVRLARVNQRQQRRCCCSI